MVFRPAAIAFLSRWTEAGIGLGLGLFGLWVAMRGGWFFAGLGAGLVALGAGLAVLGVRRARFLREVNAPGLVELDEGRIRYLHPRASGEVSLADLAAIRLLRHQGQRLWQFDDLSGQRLIVPVEAAGANGLFDALALMPGLSSADLVAALSEVPPLAIGHAAGANVLAFPGPETREIWRREGRGIARRDERG